MRLASTRRAGAALACLTVIAASARAQEGTWALTNARIETVTRGVIERGTIVIRNGLIAAVGASVTVPADARVLDLAGRTVYPGFIDLTSSLGLPAAPAPAAGGGGGGGGGGAAAAAATAANSPVGLEPDRLVAEELRPVAADIRGARDAGFTAVLAAPSRGAFRGLSALIPLRDSVERRDVVRSPVALHMGFQGVGGGFGGGRYPGSLLGVIAYERQAFYDAQRQGLLKDRYRANPRGMERPANDARLDALVPVVRGEVPVFFAAGNEGEINRAIGLAREFNLQLTVVGATEGFRMVDRLVALRRPVVVSVDFPASATVTGWQYRFAQQRPLNDSAAADSAVRAMVTANAATLNRAGVRIALASGGTLRPAEFMSNVKKAIAAGLPRDTALAGLTIRPAEIAGVGAQLGSIEEGKIANLVVSQGDVLGDSGRVQMVFVDGIRYEATPAAPATAGGGRRGSGPGAAAGEGAMAQMAGTWDIVVNSPQGAQTVTMTVTQTGSSIAGSMTSQMGTSPVTNGEVSGNSVSWSMTITMGGQTIPLSYRGTVDGNRISGQVTLGEFGTAPFTGEKRP